MPLACRICHSVLHALRSGRCRKCDQLVCADCVAEGAFRQPGGALCRKCAASDPEKDIPAAAAPANHSGRLGWFVFGLLLAGLFLAILTYPWWQAERLARQMRSPHSADALAAGRALGELGGRPAFSRLEAALRSGERTERLAAIQGLARTAGNSARVHLGAVRDRADAPEEERTAALEALLLHQRLFPRPPDGTR